MSRGMLLDTNLLIKAFDLENDTKAEDRQAAKQKLRDLLEDDSVVFAISPLIRYEFLRNIEWGNDKRYQNLEAKIQNFDEFDIDKEVSDLATSLYQLYAFESAAANIEINKEKRKFDTFHLAVAKCNNLELASDDSDIARLEPLYDRLIEARSTNPTQEYINNTNPEENA